MNNNVLLIRDKKSYFSDQIVGEANPKQKTIIQFSHYNKVLVSRQYKKNVCIPYIPCLEDLSFPRSYGLISNVCVSNDYSKSILSTHNIESSKLNFIVPKHQDQLKISSGFNTYYKYGIIVNFKQDFLILEDLIYVFYEAHKHLSNSVLILAIESDDNKQVFSFIDKIHQQLNIKPAVSKLIVAVNNRIDDTYKLSIINSIDCLLQLNTLFVSDLEYYYAIACQKRIIGKYNLDANYSIDTIDYYKQLFKLEDTYNFFHQFDHQSLYNRFLQKNTCEYGIWKNKENTGIERICDE